MKTVAAITIALLMVVALGLAGCGQEQFTIQEGVLLVGVNLDAPWLMESGGGYEGFGPAVLTRAADELGLEVEYVPSTMQGRASDLDSGKFDVVGSPVGITPPNEKGMSITDPVATTRLSLIVLKDSPVETPAGLTGKAVGILEDVPDQALAAVVPGDEELKKYPDEDALYKALDSGTVQAIEAVSAEYLYRDKGGRKYREVTVIGDELSWGFGVRKGNTELLDKLNEAIGMMEQDGSLEKLRSEWLSE